MSGTGDDGFTLLEMLVTLAVVGLVASIGFPVVQSSFDRLELDRAVTDTRYAVRSARALAISRGQRVQLVRLEDGSLSAAGTVFAAAPAKSVTITLPTVGLTFYPGGEALAGEVALRARGTERRIVVRADGLVE
ncbi:GspH/FimT family pseudopilin [Novosphingobium sp. MMS21-SN21R]|uniref:GspH/FimT family pseudopilin n=1 Tax=Novosphingobium sp. MMS21-SN21R TaxID=2969298 RepID=UPI002884389A|nr:GspH/FimT family pseudopilin [Novosphingobium sp. MMS21-SN21R]MDT0508408.1 prepilin-type N-terminal cleavage/methylation domain-containing protein [Novosphingobium sp. MMS21-SN21R]